MILYENGYIYKIHFIPNPNIFYIGSSHSFINRCESHKKTSLSSNRKLYRFVGENGGWANFKFTIIDVYYNIPRSTLLRIEGSYQQTLKAPLNMNIAGRTQIEYITQNREFLRKNSNREIICSKCGKKGKYKNISRHKKSKRHLTSPKCVKIS